MKHIHRTALSLVIAFAGVAAAQDRPVPEQQPAPGKRDEAGVRRSQEPAIPVRASDAEREMVELFGTVERTLQDIDRLLREAANAPRAAGSGETELARKLREARQNGDQARQGIDRILELARQMNPSGSGGGSGQEPQSGSSGQSPLDGQGQQSTGRESTPSTPEPGASGEPKGQQQQPGQEPGEKPGDARKPDGPQATNQAPHERRGGDPRGGEQGGAASPGDARDRWGDLPMHAREVFRNEGGRDMPPLYREWIDAYYRRLNQKP